MGKLSIDRDYRGNGPAPLYCRYDGQSQSQPAQIRLTEDGNVYATYNAEIGNTVTFNVWYGRTRIYGVDSNLSVNQIDMLFDEIEPLLERVFVGLSVEWNGNNNVGYLTDDAQIAENEIESICNGYDGEIEVWDIDEWFCDGIYSVNPSAEKPCDVTLDDVYNQIEADEISENVLIEGDAEGWLNQQYEKYSK